MLFTAFVIILNYLKEPSSSGGASVGGGLWAGGLTGDSRIAAPDPLRHVGHENKLTVLSHRNWSRLPLPLLLMMLLWADILYCHTNLRMIYASRRVQLNVK